MIDEIGSILFVPGTRPDRFGKALASQADLVVIDLEDAVPAEGKAAARDEAIAALAAGDPRLTLRINGLRTRDGLADLLALAAVPLQPTLLLVPMVESEAEIAILTAVLGTGASGIVPLIETVKGLAAAPGIAAANGVEAMMFGGGDFSAELGVDLAWEPLLHARSAFVLACAGAGVPAIDVPFVHLDDPEGLAGECAGARRLGFSGKAAVHPGQVEAINAAFRLGAEEIAEAEEAQRAFQAAGGAAVRFRGRMLEAPIMRKYQRILSMRSKTDA